MAKKKMQRTIIQDSHHNRKQAMPPAKKQRRSNRCSICNTNTFQKDALCVLCKAGINQKYDELRALIEEHKQWTFLNQT
jgi:hypothetical protein